MHITLYGIPNCDTVKKARTWLAERHPETVFHDFKKQGLNAETVATWIQQVPRDVLINKKGLTWRNLSDQRKAAIVDDASAIALMLEQPSVIKRPVLDKDGQICVGYSADQYQQIFSA
ncbi:ArsC family reductase [Pseudoduganella danionis]|uniref:ArsC family reductase n=1 Tax=Pseudoduganella danionis TaxID=1890295 RepID=A0ABW9SNQ1_9BURK|nr:ArsC family reductase [Pseudoduganella danionis]MTW33661.1 ArsC family reductase [Pseudoduganella danionis]